jgi:hypothetical protein
MKRSMELLTESVVISVVLILIVLGGSITTSSVPLSWGDNLNPNQVARESDLDALALYYNTTLTELGTGLFANVSLLLNSFHSVNIPPVVNQTALAANIDVASMNTSIPKAFSLFDATRLAIGAKEYVNATALVNEGCENEGLARQSLSDFNSTQTPRLSALSVPKDDYALGESRTADEVSGLLAECNLLRSELPTGSANLTLSSPQKSIETGESVALGATLRLGGAAVGDQTALLYLNGSYFGSMVMSSGGISEGQVSIPFVYRHFAVVQAIVAPNATADFAGARSNLLNFTILFNSTRIVLGDPTAYLPTFSFAVKGNLTTFAGAPLPGATVRVTFIDETMLTKTDSAGRFNASFIVPANATDGVHDVYAAFAPKGVFGPSTNFTSIDVVRDPLIVNLVAPSLSFAGFATAISGTATANGTAVSNALVTVDTPWGSARGVTDATGHFRLDFQVSPFELLFGAQVTVSATPPKPYIKTGYASAQLGILNPLIVILPLLFVSLATFEANQVREFKRRAPRQEAETFPDSQETAKEIPRVQDEGGHALPEILAYYIEAVSLASARFGLEVEESKTVRETAREISGREASVGSEAFSRLMLTVEDYLYSASFDSRRVQAAKIDLDAVKEAWK